MSFGKEGPSLNNRTFLVTAKDGSLPFEGRSRDDLEPFSLPQYPNKHEVIVLFVLTGLHLNIEAQTTAFN